MAKTISVYDVLVNFVSLVTFMLDVGTDILVTVQLFENGDIIWGALTAAFIAVPTLLVQIFSLKWHITDKTLSALTCLPHLFLFAPVQRYLRVIRLSLKARSTRSFHDIDQVYREQNDVCILRLLESFLEAAPQLCLQLYIILITRNITPLSGISVASSLVSLAWALTAYSDGLRLAYRDMYSRSWCSLLTHWVWQTSMTAARVMAFVVFATVFKAWVFLAAGLHWIAMTIWISVRGTDFGEGACERGLFQIVAGFIYIFCFLNLREGRSRHRMLAFYLIILLENTALVALWFVYKDETVPVMDYVTPSVVFGGFLLGLLSLLLYYRFLHPSGPVYLYTVKSVVHNGVLNNQRDDYPGIFDATAGTQLSVLGSDIIELSRDMDRTTLSLSRISNRSPGNFSQQHLQLAWESGLIGRSSSSDSSLDMMDFGKSRSCTQNGTLTSSRSASSTRQLLRNSRQDLNGSQGRMYSDQADRRDQMNDVNCTASSRRQKVFTEKDLYGFHEHRFHGTYHSPVRSNDFVLEVPPSLSPLDAAKLWEETTGRMRSPLVGKDDDTLSTLDASDLLEQSYGREKSASSWSSFSRLAASYNGSVRNEGRFYDEQVSKSRSNSRTASRSDLMKIEPWTDHNIFRESYLKSSLPHQVAPSESGDSDAASREADPVYEHISHAISHATSAAGLKTSLNGSVPDRSGYDNNPVSSRQCSPRYETAQIRQHGGDSQDISDATEDESGVFTNTSNKSDRMHLQYHDISLQNSPEPVYAVPYTHNAAGFQHTQSAPGPLRHVGRTSQGLQNGHGLQYGNNEDIPNACKSVLPDTPWKLDYLNLEPLKTVLLKMQYIPENRKQLVREYLKDLNDSINGSCQPSPLKVQDFQNSPCRFGRSIDLFNSDAWHAVERIVDSKDSLHSDDESKQMSTMPVSGRRSRRSLLSQDSDCPSRLLSGGSDSGYQPFQRSYLDSQNQLKETSPYGIGRHSSKMSCIRGVSASGAPVRGSPMPVRNRSKDHVERRKSRELEAAQKSHSQSSLNGRFRKRLSKENKENTNDGIDHTSKETYSQPVKNRYGQRYSNDSRDATLQKRKSAELHQITSGQGHSYESRERIVNNRKSFEDYPRTVQNVNPGSALPDDLCPSLTSSYRQAINNTARSTSTLNNSLDQSDLKLDDLHTDPRKQGQGHRRSQDRQPFQAIQNSPVFSPLGDNRRQQALKPQTFDTFSSTPKLSSSLHSLALLDMYSSPVMESVCDENRSGSANRIRQTRRKDNKIPGRAKSVDCIR